MGFREVAEAVAEHMEGAFGDLDQFELVTSMRQSVAMQLVEIVTERLGCGIYPVRHLDPEILDIVHGLIASAMRAQYEYDKKAWGDLIDAIDRQRRRMPEQAHAAEF